MKVTRVDTGTKGEFKAIKDGNQIGEMSYVWKNPDTFIIDHTGVAPAFKGQGVGQAMVKEAVCYARENNMKVMPLCSFANAIFRRHPDYGDVLFVTH